MAFMDSMSLVASGMTAQQLRLDIVSENITNMGTTRTENGGPYRRKMVVLEEEPRESFQSVLRSALDGGAAAGRSGVRVAEIVEDPSDFKLVYDPTHPDANAEGYVEMPNVDLVKEMADAMAANQALSADITAFKVLKTVAAKGLEIGR